MYWDQFAAQWEEQKQWVRKRWDKLTDDDVREIHGKFEGLVAKIMARYGLSIQTAERQILAFLRSIEARGDKREHKREAAHHH
jgi:uncharacterized protein YjbJ (UPF0337 family)